MYFWLILAKSLTILTSLVSLFSPMWQKQEVFLKPFQVLILWPGNLADNDQMKGIRAELIHRSMLKTLQNPKIVGQEVANAFKANNHLLSVEAKPSNTIKVQILQHLPIGGKIIVGGAQDTAIHAALYHSVNNALPKKVGWGDTMFEATCYLPKASF